MDGKVEIDEKPIIFNWEMARLIRYQTKTQTRRVIKPQPYRENGRWCWEVCKGTRPTADTLEELIQYMTHPYYNRYWPGLCPYRPGLHLWVREAWQRCPHCATLNYKATTKFYDCWECGEELGAWKPSIHMFKEYSTLRLEVVGVRIEHVQEISENDARAEGVSWSSPQPYGEKWDDDDREDPRVVGYPAANASFARDNFRRLWDSINTKRGFSWRTNPLVWVVEFKQLT